MFSCFRGVFFLFNFLISFFYVILFWGFLFFFILIYQLHFLFFFRKISWVFKQNDIIQVLWCQAVKYSFLMNGYTWQVYTILTNFIKIVFTDTYPPTHSFFPHNRFFQIHIQIIELRRS